MEDIVITMNKIPRLRGKIQYYIDMSIKDPEIFLNIFDLVTQQSYNYIYRLVYNHDNIKNYCINYFKNNPLEIFKYNHLINNTIFKLEIEYNYNEIINYLKKNITSYVDLPNILKKNKSIIKEIIDIKYINTWITYLKINNDKYYLLPNELKTNINIAEVVFNKNTDIKINLIPKLILTNKKIFIMILSNNPHIFNELKIPNYLKKFMENKENILECIKNNTNTITYISSSLLCVNFVKDIIFTLHNTNMLALFILCNPTYYYLLPDELKISLKYELITSNYKLFPEMFEFYSNYYKNNLSIDDIIVSKNIYINYYLKNLEKRCTNLLEFKLYKLFTSLIEYNYNIIIYFNEYFNEFFNNNKEYITILKIILNNNPQLLLKTLYNKHTHEKNHNFIINEYKKNKIKDKTIIFWKNNIKYLKEIYNYNIKFLKNEKILFVKKITIKKKNEMNDFIEIEINENEHENNNLINEYHLFNENNDLIEIINCNNYKINNIYFYINQYLFLKKIYMCLKYSMHRKYTCLLALDIKNPLPRLPSLIIKHITSFMWDEYDRESNFPFIQR